MPADPHLVFGISGTISSVGDNDIIIPPAGQSVRLFYICLNAPSANAASVTARARFGANPPIYTLNLVPGAIWARNIGAGRFYQQSQAVDEKLTVSLDGPYSVCWSVEYLTLP